MARRLRCHAQQGGPMYVRRWMTAPPAMLLADTPAGDALRFMECRDLQHLAVLGESGFLGLVSRDGLRIAVGKSGDGWAPRRGLELGAAAAPCLSVPPSET